MAKWNILTLVLVMLVIAAVGYVLLSGEYVTPDKNVVVNETEEPVELLAPGEVRDNAVDAFNSVTSYRFKTDSVVKTDRYTRELKKNGSVDSVGRRMQVIQVDGDVTRVTYIIDGITYMSAFAEWSKTAAPGWQDMLGQEIELMRDVDVELAGEERVGGVDCYVLFTNPDIVKALHLDSLNLSEDKLKSVLDNIESISLTEWVGKDDYLLRKSVMKEVSVDGRERETSTVFYDYNQPVVIELPEEALSAIEAEM